MNFRTQVFKRAHIIAKNTGKAFAICLIKAWECYRLKQAMTKQKVKFAYEKVDGSIRYAMGTLQDVFIGDVKGLSSPNPKVVSYFDLDAMSFRCFKAENLIRIY